MTRNNLPLPKPRPILTGNVRSPNVAIQCFESRHADCDGRNTLFGVQCMCACHHHNAAKAERI